MRIEQRLALIAAGFLLALSGCSGSNYNGPPPIDGRDVGEPRGDLTVVVKARDAFGSPVPDADVMVLYSSGVGAWATGVRTNADGRAVVELAPDDTWGVALTGDALYGHRYEASSVNSDRMTFNVVMHPSSSLAAGIGGIEVEEVNAAATRLTFRARVYVMEDRVGEPYWWWGGVAVEPCSDCIGLPGGNAAGYGGETLSDKVIEPRHARYPLSIALLLDQGESVTVSDPEDQRLLASRYLATRLADHDEMAFAAFAADDTDNGQPALLPSQPVTFFPLDNPAFTTDGRSYFTSIDSLATLEGGASPLFDAVGETIGFTASAAPPDSRSAVIAVTGGGAGNCGDTAECRAAQEALLTQSTSSGVALVVVARSDAAGDFDRSGVGPLAQSDQGVVFWADDARQIPTIVGRIPEVLDGRHAATDVRIRLESPVAGAFNPGNLVSGTLQVTVCPWDCNVLVSLPFALRVP